MRNSLSREIAIEARRKPKQRPKREINNLAREWVSHLLGTMYDHPDWTDRHHLTVAEQGLFDDEVKRIGDRVFKSIKR
jgi:hypothetical protein